MAKTKKKTTGRAPNKGGRPSKHNKTHNTQVKILTEKGFTDKEISKVFEISKTTLNKWKKDYPEFMASLKAGKEIADNQVVRALFQRATGYTHPEIHITNHKGYITKTQIIKHYAPDTTACIFWLKNRDRDNWRDKLDHELTGKDGEPLPPVTVIIGNTKKQE